MNIKMQVASIVIMLVLLYFHSSQRTLKLSSEISFMSILYTSIICCCLDVLSVVLISGHEHYPDGLITFVGKLYISSLVLTAMLVLEYALVEAYSGKTLYNKTLPFAIITTAAIIAIFCSPIYFSYDVVYSYGPACYITYGAVAIFFTSILVSLILHRKTSATARTRAIGAWLASWIICAVIQFIFPQMLLVGFSGCLGNMFLYIVLENPSASLDRSTGFFNTNLLSEKLKSVFAREIDSGAVGFTLSSPLEFGSPEYLATLSAFCDKLLTDKRIQVFHTSESSFLAFAPEGKSVSELRAEISEALSFASGINGGSYGNDAMTAVYFFVPSVKSCGSPEDFMELFNHVQRTYADLRGGETIFIDDAMTEEHIKYHEAIQLIEDAVKGDRIELFYQQIYNLYEKKFTAAEALVRIRRPDGTLAFPDNFITAAEASGKILELGEEIFRHIFRFMKEENLKQYGLKYIEINLSVKQGESPHLATKIIKLMQEYNISPNSINLEITETSSPKTREFLLENMKTLMDYGVSFSLDDFGSGSSNLNYVIDMPVKFIKFDKDMTLGYFSNVKAQAVILHTARMAHEMGLKVVAEGVETLGMLNSLDREVGVDYIQGYYFSKPIPGDDFIDFLVEHNT